MIGRIINLLQSVFSLLSVNKVCHIHIIYIKYFGFMLTSIRRVGCKSLKINGELKSSDIIVV